jgi:hypothetical protein
VISDLSSYFGRRSTTMELVSRGGGEALSRPLNRDQQATRFLRFLDY